TASPSPTTARCSRSRRTPRVNGRRRRGADGREPRTRPIGRRRGRAFCEDLRVSAAPEVVVFLRAGCHLCADAIADLDVLREQEPFVVRTVDIERDDRLHARYLERIPVIAVAGEELCDFAVDGEKVLAAVRDLRARREAA